MHLNKKWIAMLMLAVLALCLTACGEKKEEAAPAATLAPTVHAIVGQWVMDWDLMMQGVSQEEYEANKELYDTSEVVMEFTADGKLFMYITAGDKSETREITYSVSGNELSFMGTTGIFAIQDDKLTLVQNGVTITYTRRK